MDFTIAFVAGITIAGALLTANRAIDVWKASVVPQPKSNPELDKVRIALSEFDSNQILAAIDDVKKRMASVEAGFLTKEKLVDLYSRMNVLSTDMAEMKSVVVKLQAASGWKSLRTGATPQREEPADG